MPQPSTCSCRTLTPTCPCHLFFRTFKAGVCPASNPPNASAGLQGNNSSSYYMPLPSVFQGVQDCRLPAVKPPKHFQPSRRPPRQQLLQLHVPAICSSGGSRLPFGLNPPKRFQPSRRPPRQQLLQLLHAPAICFSGGSRLPFARPQPPKRFQPSRRPPRQQLLQLLHAPAICFSGGSRLPFARPQTPQTLPTLPQASKATTLTATCPCHLFLFKTAVCPASNPPNASAGLQGNNSYSYMPLPSVFQGVQDCRLPAVKPPNASAGLQGNNSYSYMSLPSVFQGVQPSRRPPRQQLLQLLHAPAICFSGGLRLPFARPQTPQTLPTLPQASKATTLTATCPCHLFFRGFKTAVCLPSNPPNASAGLQGNNSYSYMPLPSVFQGVQDCRLPALKPPKRFCRPPRQQLLQLHAPAICFSGGLRLPFARPQSPQTLPTLLQACKATTLTAKTLPQASKATTLTATCPCHLFFRGFKTAVCPPSNPPNASAGLQGNNSYSYMPLPSVFQGVQDCRLPALNPPKRSRRPPRQQLLQLHASAICSSGGSRLPFARPQTPQTLPQASKATTLTATCPCHLFFRGFKTAVCLPSIPPNASNPPAGLQGNNSYSYYMPLPSVFQGVQDCRLPALKPPNASNPPAGLQGNNSYSYYMPLPSVFQGFKTAVCPPSNPPNASAGLQGNNSYYSYMPLPSVFQGVQDCRLPALKPPKRFRRPPRQQLLQLHASAICFSGGSRLPFARPQTPQTLPTLPQACKATTLTATCPCHLFFKGSRLPFARPQSPKRFQPSRRPPRQQLLQLHVPAICFSGGSRLPFARPQTPKRFCRPPRQQLLQLHAPAICFSGGLRLPFARPQSPQTLPTLLQACKATTLTAKTLPQASKATTLTATCPCHLFFRGFKTAVCPPSNPPNASAGLQGNNSYSYMPLPSVFQGVQDCRLPALNPPNAPAGLQGNNSYSYMPLPSVLQGVQDCRLPALKPPKRFRRPPRQQLLQLHAPAICFSGGSRLPFACPQSPQTLPTLPQASKATTLTATTCPCHLFFKGFKTAVCPPSNPPNASNPPAGLQGNNSYSYYMPLPSVFQGFKTAVCPPSNPPNASAGLQGNNSYYSYMPLPSVFQGVQDCRLPALKPPKRFRRPPRQQLLQLHASAICFSGGSRLPFARPQTPQTLPTLPQACKATTLTATCPCHLFFKGSRLPFARPQSPQTLPTLPQASKATTLTATCPCHLFFRGFKTAVCPPQTPQTLPQASKATTLTATTCPCHLFFRGFKTAVCPASNPPNASNPLAGLQGNNSYSYMPLPSVFQGVQDCRLPGLKPSKPFRRPPRQQLLQLHAPAICFSGGSRLYRAPTGLFRVGLESLYFSCGFIY